MSPSKLLLLRHAEKPADLGPPHGVAYDGTQNPAELTIRGWQRAGALARLLGAGAEFPKPDVIFAAGPRPGHPSLRPLSTVQPLADRLGLTLRTEFSKGDETSLIGAVLACDGVVLVCWQHEMIPVIATALLGSPGACPQQWPGRRYDLIWALTPMPSGGWSFEQAPLLLLQGDQEEPIPLQA